MVANLFVISGPSGVGKDTLMALIFQSIPNLNRWITCTTRKPREGEKDGVDYFFKSKEQFKDMLSKGELVEWNEFAGNYYGTQKEYVEEKLEAGQNVITTIDVNGAAKVKETFPFSHLIFIEPPSLDALRQRLVGRGTEDTDSINKRLSIVESELSKKNIFDVVFVNDNLKKCCEQITSYVNQFIN